MPTIANVTQRDDQQDPRCVAELGRRDEPTSRRGRRSEVASDELEEWLREVEIPTRAPTRHGEQQRQPARHQPEGLKECGRLTSIEPDVWLCSLARFGLDLHRPAILFNRGARACRRSAESGTWRRRGL